MSVAIDSGVGVAQIVSMARQIEQRHPAILSGRQDFVEINEMIGELERQIFSSDLDGPSSLAILETFTREQMLCLTDAYCFWETQLEHRFANDLIDGRVQPSDYLLYERFDNLLRRELALVGHPAPERILFIGSGPFPITAMHLHFQTGWQIDCVDSDVSAVTTSRIVVDACGLGNAIRIFYDKGEGYRVGDYDLILVALLAKPKARILGNLRKGGKPGFRVLCRTSLHLRQLVYEPTAERDLRGFHVAAQQVAVGDQTISTLLMEKAQSAAKNVRLEWLSEVDESTGTQLVRLMNRVLEEETTIGFAGPVDRETGMFLMGQLDGDVQSRRRHVMVARKDDQIVGQLIFTPNRLQNCSHIVELSCGIIDRSFRGGGLALKAFREVICKCEELHHEIICLDVRAGTAAATWWSHFGFEAFGMLQDYARVGNKRYKGVFMSQTVDSLKQRLEKIDRPIVVSSDINLASG